MDGAQTLPQDPATSYGVERQLTHAAHGHLLTNIGVWSFDGQWIVYDVRSDPQGTVFDGLRIERVHIETGKVQTLHESRRGASCGVATCSPVEEKAVFIQGPERPTPEWDYGASRRQGLVVDRSGSKRLESRDLIAPFTPGALRGGTHVHVFSGDGKWVSFTYDDQVLELNQRNVGVAVPVRPVVVPTTHCRNHDGEYFSVIVTQTIAEPRPGSDEIKKAFEDAWVGTDGYLKPDGTRQKRALAFQGLVVTSQGDTIAEAFIVDLPENVTMPGDGPLEGTATRLPQPPKGTVQRRLTFTAQRKFPGLQGPRHWLRSSPDGSQIALLMRDDAGIVQLWTVSPHGGPPVQITSHPWSIASAFSWSPDGRWIAHVMDNSVFATEAATGKSIRLTPRTADESAPRPEACVFSPDGSWIAYVRNLLWGGNRFNQIFIVSASRCFSG